MNSLEAAANRGKQETPALPVEEIIHGKDAAETDFLDLDCLHEERNSSLGRPRGYGRQKSDAIIKG